MTMRGLTSAYLMRRIWPLQAGDTILLHAAAGGVGLIVSQWAKLLGLTVIGTVSSEAKAEVARAHGCDHVIDYTPRGRREARARADERHRRERSCYDSVGKDTFAGIARFAQAARASRVRRDGLGPDPADRCDAARDQGSVYVTRPALADYIADPAEKSALAGELFDHVAAGRIRIEINQRYRLPDAAQAHRDLESRKTTGSSIFVI